MSTRVGNLTKTQKMAAALKGTFGNRAGPSCTSDLYLLSSTDACDVPGPIRTLYLDPSVPLYNYKSTSSNLENSAGTGTVSDDVVIADPWKAVIDENVAFPMVINGSVVPRGHIAYLAIYPTVSKPITTYSFVIPVALRVQGLSPATILGTASAAAAVITADVVSPPIVEIYYNNQVVPTNSMQISASFIPVTWSIGANMDINTSFFAEQFIGNIRVHGVKLTTQPYYVFEIRIGISISETSSSSVPDTATARSYTAYANISPDFILSDRNQIFSNPPCDAPIQPFQITDDSTVVFPP